MDVLMTAGRLVGALVALWALAHLVLRERGHETPAIIAHRGAAGRAPENTLAGIEAGLMSGAQFIEVDVQRTQDGILVLMHDATVDRTTDGTGRVSELSYQHISQLDAGSWFSSSFEGEKVPRLDEVFDLLEGWSGTLVVEVKFPDDYPGIAIELAELFERYANTSVSVVSFDHEWLANFRVHAPTVPLAQLSVYPTILSRSEGTVRIGVFWPSVIADPSLVRRAKAAGLHIWVYTADYSGLKSLLAWLGVDGITTNYP